MPWVPPSKNSSQERDEYSSTKGAKNAQQNWHKKNQQRRWELLKVNNYGLRANSFCFPIDEKTKRELAPIYTLGYIT